MSQVVFVVGAGASREAGGPLMQDFLDIADKLRCNPREVGDALPAFNAVFEALGELDLAHAKSVLDVYNIESVFGAFEMARLCRRLGTYTEDQIDSLGPAIRRLIVKTLERSIKYPVERGTVRAPRPYDALGSLIAKIPTSGASPVAFITFNYDLALDYMIYSMRRDVDYFGAPAPLASGAIPLLKLHGSLNWGRCTECNNVAPWTVAEFFRTRHWGDLTDVSDVRLDLGSQLAHFQHCQKPCQPEAVIVPPTWNKTEYQASIVSVWQQAAKHLSEAEHIFVIGYSLPETDQFFRYLYALGTIGKARVKTFMVVDPSEDSARRFENLLGPTARYRFQHWHGLFSQSVVRIQSALGLPE